MEENLYEVEIVEVLSRTIEISATSEDEAYSKAQQLYLEQEFVLNSDDYSETEIVVIGQIN